MGPEATASPQESAPRLVEVIAALSLASDLGLGQPMEHGLRTCLIATRLADAIDLDASEREAIYWMSLLAMVGCTADSFELSELFGDDIALRQGMYEVGPTELAQGRYFMSRAGSDGGPLRRVRAGAGLALTGMRAVMDTLLTDCQITGRFAERLGLGESVRDPLQEKFARWDGKGFPKGLAGEDIALPARMHGLTWRLEAAHRVHGVDAALELAERHAGATLDPNLVAALLPAMPEVLEGLDEESWEAVIADEPARARLTGDAFEGALEAIADFADLKSPWFAGHSRGVAELAEAAGWRLGLSEPDVTLMRRAALVHSLGRTGVPNTIWDKDGPLTVAERERMQLYPYFTERILKRGSLSELSYAAATSQERLDGSGYPRGLKGNAIPVTGKVLAAADVYQALCEPRAHRAAMPADEAALQLHSEVKDGLLDGEAAEAVLTASGHRPQRQRSSAPADLTPREIEVLRIIARGRTSAEAARELGIETKTVSTHIEHIYAKIGASNRSVATLFAMEHGLI